MTLQFTDDVVVCAVRINSNVSALAAQRQLARATSEVGSISERLSSGMRINRASDDAAGLAIASQLRADSRVKAQALRNINDFQSLTSVANGAVEALRAITIRQRELASQAANGTYSEEQRGALQQEMTKLSEEYNRVVGSTSFNNLSLLANSDADYRVQMGYGEENSLSFNLTDPLKRRIEAGSYFTLDGFGGDNSAKLNYYIWFNVDGAGSDPRVDGRVGIEVNIGESLQALSESTRLVITDPAQLYGQSLTFSVADGAGGESDYYLWFNNTDGGNPNPGLPGTGIQVDYNGSSTAADVVSSAAAALGALSSTLDVSYSGGTSVTITSRATGSVTNAQSSHSSMNAITVRDGRVAGQLTPGRLAELVANAINSTNDYTAVANAHGQVSVTANSRATRTIIDYGVGFDLQQGTGIIPNAFGTLGMVARDLNGDGLPDLVTGLSGSNGFGVQLNIGGGLFADPVAYDHGGWGTFTPAWVM